jgi:MFS family permease
MSKPHMNAAARRVQRVYLGLLLLNTLAASLIWGINTLFLLDAGLSNAQAFAANAFFTAGMMIFEVPTGIVADTRGRRASFLLGTCTLALTTLGYLWLWHLRAPFWAWALVSVLLGLGFTFFSGAFEAWLVDSLTAAGYFREQGTLDSVLARGTIVEGAAMLGGSVAGGAIAQFTSLAVPYALRALLLAFTFAAAFAWMRDDGFRPSRGKSSVTEVKRVLRASIEHGLGNPATRWVMLAAPFTGGVAMYAFYAMQPYLLELYGRERAYGIAGLAAAIVGGAQIAGGLLAPQLRRFFRRRTSVLIAATAISAVVLAIIGAVPHFALAITCLMLWGLMFAAMMPVRQAYLNGLIASDQRATVLSFDSLLDSSGGVAAQPLLGRVADVWGYPASYLGSAAVQVLALPLIWLARKERAPADEMLAAGQAS